MNLKCYMLLKVKGDEDVGVKVRVRVQKSKVHDKFFLNSGVAQKNCVRILLFCLENGGSAVFLFLNIFRFFTMQNT